MYALMRMHNCMHNDVTHMYSSGGAPPAMGCAVTRLGCWNRRWQRAVVPDFITPSTNRGNGYVTMSLGHLHLPSQRDDSRLLANRLSNIRCGSMMWSEQHDSATRNTTPRRPLKAATPSHTVMPHTDRPLSHQ
jgi:hypothetical protein